MNKYALTISLCAALAFTSCTDYLDVKPHGKTLPKSAEEFSALLQNRMNRIDVGTDNTIIGNISLISDYECYSDNLDANLHKYPGGNTMPVYIGSSINAHGGRYRDLYATIRDCNLILENVKGKDASSEMGQKVLGTAYALRAISYYNLIRTFAEPYDKANATSQLGVPVVTTFDMEEKPIRATLQRCIDLIVADLEKAISYNVTDKEYLFTIDVAQAFLVRTHFWAENWDEVISVGEPLLAKYPLIQGTDYINMIQDRYNLKGNVFIRSYRFPGSGDVSYNATTESLPLRPVSKELVDLFVEKEDDVRYTLSFNSKRQNQKNCCARVRSAEICLAIAEAYAHKNQSEQALNYLNLLRSNRIANYTPLTLGTLPAVDTKALIRTDAANNSLTPLMQSILNERQKELYMEGDRWFDMKRNGRPSFWVAKDGLKYETQTFMYTAPFPKDDVKLVHGLKQNPGYTE